MSLWQVNFAIILILLAILVIGVRLSNYSHCKIKSTFVVTNDGVVFFPETRESCQLGVKTRVSFFALWLEFEPLHEKTINKAFKNKLLVSTKRLFLFRDSLTRQDFSNLLNVIRELK